MRFAEQVRRTPDAPAVECDGEVLTYSALDRRSDVLAARLRRAGVAVEDRVGVCVEPSLGLVVAQLGALKAGAAFVPIDPGYPDERLSYLLTDSAAVVVVSEPRFAARLPDGPVKVFLDGDDRAAGVPQGAVEVHPDNAACVIYTSGSTGDPKGVVITHRNLVHLAGCAASRFSLRPGDRFLQMASISFSAFLEEVYPSLLVGATVLLAGRRRALTSTRALLKVLEQQRVSGFGITTALWHSVVDDMVADGDRFPDTLRFVLMGGEAARSEAVRQWTSLDMALVHVYGPTEATATATYLHTDEYTPGAGGDWSLPIGRVIPETSVYLLDDRMRQVADGVAGELYVGGLPVTRGYLGRPAMTAARFVPDPFGAPGSRMYRTGDLGKLRPDGNFEFAGRVDNQLKINGYRIEPTEIEGLVEKHPDVARACVVAHRNASGDQGMVAYVVAVARESAGVDVYELREHLAALVPEFMVPGAWVPVDSLPLTPNGKVDRSALARLPLPAAAAPVAPADAVEAAVADIWRSVLGVEEIGVVDDFFDLGGDSLKVARVISRTRRVLGVELPHKAVFDNRTIRELAAIVRALASAGAASDDTEAAARRKRELLSRALYQRIGVRGGSTLAAGQRGLWFMNELLDHSPVYNAPWWCRLQGGLDVAAFRSALAAVVRRHDALRSRFRTVDGIPVQVVEADADIGWEHVDLRELPPQDREPAAFALAAEEAATRIDVRAQVMRVRLLRLADDEHLLVVNAHHLVFDGASSEVFIRELSAYYDSYIAGDELVLPELPVQYADFAAWQGDHLKGATLDRLTAFWRNKLSGAPVLELPQDDPGSSEADRPAGTLRVALPTGVRDDVDRIAAESSATRFMVLFAVFLVMLHRRCGQDDMSVGTPVSHRPLPSHEQLIGYFVNTLVLRCDLAGDPTFRQLVGRVREVCVEAYNHQELPLDVLVERLGRQDAPRVRATFSVDRAAGHNAGFSSLRVLPGHEISTGKARFDLVWLVEDMGKDLHVSVDYDSKRFHESTIRNLVAEFTDLLRVTTTGAATPLSQLGQRTGMPIDQLTQQLCEMFAQVFGADSIAPEDDFFELGGYSALAAELAARIRDRYSVDLSLRAFFDEPTVAGIAAKIHGDVRVVPDQPDVVDETSLEGLLQEIEGLSEEEINAILNGDQ